MYTRKDMNIPKTELNRLPEKNDTELGLTLGTSVVFYPDGVNV